MMNQLGGSRTDTLVKLVLVFFISLLSFSVGTFVGKQVSDSDYRRASLEQEYQAFRGTASVDDHGHSHDGHSHDKAEGISESEIASLSDEFIKKETAKEEPAQPVAQKAEEKAADENGYKQMGKAERKVASTDKPKAHKDAKVEKVNPAAERVAKGKAPTPDVKKKVRLPNSLPGLASGTIGKYTVQVASYLTEGEAEEHATSLKGKGFSAFYLPAKVKGKTYYRVSVGLFTNQKSAMKYRKELMAQAKISSAIVQKIIR